MRLPPSQVKKLLERLSQWKEKAMNKSYLLREAKKDIKRLKEAVSAAKNLKHETDSIFLKQTEIHKAQDEKINQLETRVQQLECEARQADELKKTVI